MTLLFFTSALVQAFTPAPTRTFATFGNEQSKALIRSWAPHPTTVDTGVVLIPNQANMQRFVRARILLEDGNVGCIASFGEELCVILCRFSRSEHQLILPLWQSGVDARRTFEDLRQWHGERFEDGARLSGKRLEWADDQRAWNGEAS